MKFNITGMHCAACASNIEKTVSRVKAVEKVSVNLLTNTMVVEGTLSDVSEIEAAVEKIGYRAEVVGAARNAVGTENKKEKKGIVRLAVSVAVLLALMYFSMLPMLFEVPMPKLLRSNYMGLGMLQMLLALIIMIINKDFFIRGIRGLFKLTPNMDTLIALGSGISFLWSVYCLFIISYGISTEYMGMVHYYYHQLYFESCGMILVLISIGKLLEEYSKGKTTNALKKLYNMAPETAKILVDGKETEVSVKEVFEGDIFLVYPGEKIPVDGEIIEGESSVNQAALTGESIPVDKVKGDKVFSATINTSGFLKCVATKVGEDTTFSKVIQLVENIGDDKAPIAKIADRVSGIFVPVVMAIAFITFFVWIFLGTDMGLALERGIAVLVISCPCALGLATPLAIMVGNGVGAKRGILFKSSTALEEAGKTDVVVFDKTGTLTRGEPVITEIVPFKDKDTFLSLAYSLEAKSEHPLSKAVVYYCTENKIRKREVENFKILPGKGLKGIIDGENVIGGRIDTLTEYMTIPGDMLEKEKELTELGNTVLAFGYGNVPLGLIAVADEIRHDSKEAVDRLRDMGIYTVLLSGDRKQVAENIGKMAGVDEIIWEVMPDEKEQVIRSIQDRKKTKAGKRKGLRVAMVGDGINDAPALKRSDVGIAVSNGSDIAIDQSDVVLMNNSITDVPRAINLSRKTLRNIRENLFWAFFYNALLIPMAAGALIKPWGIGISPMFAALAMSLSSLFVVGNALRLNLCNVEKYEKRNKIITEDSTLIYEKGTEAEMEITLQVEGMMCEHCEKTVEEALKEIDGVTFAKADHTKNQVVVKAEKPIERSILVETVEKKNYKAK